FAVGNRNAKHRSRVGKNGADLTLDTILDERPLARARYTAENSGAERNPLAHGMSGCSGFSFDLDLFGSVIEEADADVVEAEILLNLPNNLSEKMHGIVA